MNRIPHRTRFDLPACELLANQVCCVHRPCRAEFFMQFQSGPAIGFFTTPIRRQLGECYRDALAAAIVRGVGAFSATAEYVTQRKLSMLPADRVQGPPRLSTCNGFVPQVIVVATRIAPDKFDGLS